MKSLLTILQNDLKLDFSKTIIHPFGGTGWPTKFEINPRDFLRYAKSDYVSKDNRGLINSLTNSKRAIDCQIDTAFEVFGIDYSNIPEQSNDIVKMTIESSSNLPYKLKLLSALDIAPSSLISNVRELRNKLEHFYAKPNLKQVKDSIELAELFILAVESKIKIIQDSFLITDQSNFNRSNPEGHGYWPNYKKYLTVEYDQKEMKLESRDNDQKVNVGILNQNSVEYYFMIRLLNNLEENIDFESAFKIFLEYVKHPIPSKNVSVEIEY